MQPPGGPEVYAESVVGYAQWYLQRGVGAIEVEERIAAHPDFGDIPEAVILASIARAQQNVHAGQIIREGPAGTTLGYAFSGQLEPTDRVGVRVIIELVNPYGVPLTASVVINASVYSTAGQILEAAEQWVNSGALAQRGRQSGQGTFVLAWIGDVYQGTMQNAARTLP